MTSNREFDSVQVFDDSASTYTDKTDPAQDVENSFTFLADDADILYLGDAAKGSVRGSGFQGRAVFRLATKAVLGTGDIIFEYWNGSAWATLTVTDGTSKMTADGILDWDPPANWAQYDVNGVTKYWIRLRCDGALTTNPVALSVFLEKIELPDGLVIDADYYNRLFGKEAKEVDITYASGNPSVIKTTISSLVKIKTQITYTGDNPTTIKTYYEATTITVSITYDGSDNPTDIDTSIGVGY